LGEIEKEAVMDKDRIAQNLACVEGHFHSEAENDVESALELYTNDIIFWAGFYLARFFAFLELYLRTGEYQYDIGAQKADAP